MDSLVYVVLVNFNGWEDTINCIDSLGRVTYKNIKIVAVDNGSTDDSKNILKEAVSKRENAVLLISKNNLGFSGGNNLGIQYALKNNAEYILLLNNDTEVEPDFLDEVISYMDSQENAGICSGKILRYNAGKAIWYAGGIFHKWKGKAAHIGSSEVDEGQYDHIQVVSYISGCYMLLKRSAIEKMGFLPEQYFLYCEDLAYCMEAKKNNLNLIYYPKSIIYHKVSASTGKQPDLKQYYMQRNHLFILMNYQHGIYKWTSLMYYVFITLRKIISKQLKPSIAWLACVHAVKKKNGKIMASCLNKY